MRALKIALKAAVGVVLLYWLYTQLNVQDLRALMQRGDSRYLWLGIACHFAAFPLLQSMRLHVLVKGYTETAGRTLKVYLIGAFFNNVLPSNIGGDAVRLMYLRNLKNSNWGGPFALLMMHRVSSIGVLWVLGSGYLMFRFQHVAHAFAGQFGLHVADINGKWVFAAFVLGVLGAVVAYRVLGAKLRSRLAKFLSDCKLSLQALSRATLVELTVLSVVFQLVRALGVYFLAMYLGQAVAFWDVVFVLFITAFAVVLPLTIGGMGVMESAISLMLQAFGAADTAAVTIALVNRLVLLLMAVAGGLIYIFAKEEIRRGQSATAPG